IADIRLPATAGQERVPTKHQGCEPLRKDFIVQASALERLFVILVVLSASFCAESGFTSSYREAEPVACLRYSPSRAGLPIFRCPWPCSERPFVFSAVGKTICLAT